MNLGFIGVGYVGLVTGAVQAEGGHHVTCLDIDEQKINSLNQGVMPFFEPGLEELVKRNVLAGRLKFSCNYPETIKANDIFFICVDTPSKEDGTAELKYVKSVAETIAKYMNGRKIIVNKSTVPPGTAKLVHEYVTNELNKRNENHPFSIVSNPEFLAEGSAVSDCLNPDRVVIGASDNAARDQMVKLYTDIKIPRDKIVTTDTTSAEMGKYASNLLLASKVSLINELANISEKYGADIDEVAGIVGKDNRIGSKFLRAGPGFGGSCFPKELAAIQHIAKKVGCSASVSHAVKRVNKRQKKVLGNKIIDHFKESGPAGKTVAVLGLSFKPKTDDMRQAPSIVLVKQLLREGFKVKVYDPMAMSNAKKILGEKCSIEWCVDLNTVAKDADALALVTEWDEFREMDLAGVKESMKGNAFFDSRRLFDPELMAKHGFYYSCIGRAPINVEA
ncbi:MAG: UDP-glucose/GDP-mannose dehydrogenase family protein [Chlamydiota bacterium]|nr:UDP-glucose/GDP-mannose dehydrogenase family protein [Chlamydiota bacterium]